MPFCSFFVNHRKIIIVFLSLMVFSFFIGYFCCYIANNQNTYQQQNLNFTHSFYLTLNGYLKIKRIDSLSQTEWEYLKKASETNQFFLDYCNLYLLCQPVEKIDINMEETLYIYFSNINCKIKDINPYSLSKEEIEYFKTVYGEIDACLSSQKPLTTLYSIIQFSE